MLQLKIIRTCCAFLAGNSRNPVILAKCFFASDDVSKYDPCHLFSAPPLSCGSRDCYFTQRLSASSRYYADEIRLRVGLGVFRRSRGIHPEFKARNQSPSRVRATTSRDAVAGYLPRVFFFFFTGLRVARG
ncbi:hypothetical protein PUN28_018054 [Cardiocondyla obscurior]|uniref:Uncharacterized protein n=1 Tax=Cardiocondyla obscurior TaxID=286306 RepID=A0AAW2EH30_9HYME